MTNWGILEIGAAGGAVMSIITLVSLIIKPFLKIKASTMASLKYSIVRAHREYKEEGKISRIALDCMCDMYKQYEALGGNGFVGTLIQELKNLPIHN